jgi:hypothetical protein
MGYFNITHKLCLHCTVLDIVHIYTCSRTVLRRPQQRWLPNSRWRPQNRKLLYLRNWTRYLHNSNGKTHVFHVNQLNGHKYEVGKYFPTTGNRNDYHKTGSSYISAVGQAFCKIPTATFTFSRLTSWMDIVLKSTNYVGHPEIEMAATKPEVVVSQHWDKISAQFQRQSACFRGGPVEIT